ncbi:MULTISPECIES: hypothetical protein [unclassified Streptomyces]|uniref:hypothetical protein n=1 Tax=unclassified Streptomyces TaxID=2593676 RepID=UPI00190DAFAE|nr:MULTISPECIES: hypothetical protein [unclassified Streptomyces]MBK3563214.1 hypothetical protein [Streptomyces sp. MBT62]MBK6013203.1 hypothetical protein [Streptomyces sp. MBT53]
MASTELSLPVYMRVGDQPEFRLGEFTFDLVEVDSSLQYGRPELATLLRAAADEIENPSDTSEEVPDAAPR